MTLGQLQLWAPLSISQRLHQKCDSKKQTHSDRRVGINTFFFRALPKKAKKQRLEFQSATSYGDRTKVCVISQTLEYYNYC
jgi:hypothetical protein